MKFGHLIEHDMRNIFLEKSYIKYGRETIPKPFSKKIKIEYISGASRTFHSLFLLNAKSRTIEIY